ncbi:MAG: hypothetical protein KAV87_60925, partial [Desulfobacteraceae bacterium]|nr:hypothetical protein [Desulfobacteraceae bacterium]
MNRRKSISIIVSSLVLVCAVYAVYSTLGNKQRILWNDQSPCSYAETPQEGEFLKKEIPNFHSYFRLQFEWQTGQWTEPNEIPSNQIALTKKILSEIFKPGIIPIESIDDKFLLLPDVSFAGRTPEDALVVRLKKGKYAIKIMKSEYQIFITIRPISGKKINIKQFAQEVFNSRILPAKWGKPLYHGKLRRKSKVLRAGAWSARDATKIDSSGRTVYAYSREPVDDAPIGEGLYKRVDFYTNGRFASFKIIGGPELPSATSRGWSDSDKAALKAALEKEKELLISKLERAGETKDIRALKELTQVQFGEIRKAAIEALAETKEGQLELIDLLAKSKGVDYGGFLEDKAESGSLRDDAIIKRLMGLLDRSEIMVRYEAARILGKAQEKRACDALIAAY